MKSIVKRLREKRNRGEKKNVKVNKTIPPRQVEISLLTRCIATRRQEKIFEENSEADEDEA